MNLNQLAEPFSSQDIEWRVSRSGTGNRGVYCHVLAYITARAIQERLDEVCGPENWRNESLQVFELRPGVMAMQVGISIRIGDEWVTKYDVSEPTNIEPAKGGFSGATKRAGSQWGIGRYLYHLSETFAEVSDKGGKGWEYARLSEKQGGEVYYWKPPQLPSWALPKEFPASEGVADETPIGEKDLTSLKIAWCKNRAPNETDKGRRAAGFAAFVESICGEFPHADHRCWTQDAMNKCRAALAESNGINGVDDSVIF